MKQRALWGKTLPALSWPRVPPNPNQPPSIPGNPCPTTHPLLPTPPPVLVPLLLDGKLGVMETLGKDSHQHSPVTHGGEDPAPPSRVGVSSDLGGPPEHTRSPWCPELVPRCHSTAVGDNQATPGGGPWRVRGRGASQSQGTPGRERPGPRSAPLTLLVLASVHGAGVSPGRPVLQAAQAWTGQDQRRCGMAA